MNTTPNGQIPNGDPLKKRRAVRRVPTEQAGTVSQTQPRPTQAPAAQAQPRSTQASAAQVQPRPTQAERQTPTAGSMAAKGQLSASARNEQVTSRGIEYVNVKRPDNSEKSVRTAAVQTASSSKPDKAKKKKVKVRYVGGSALGSLLKAIIYIMAVLVISGFLSYYIIMIANDVFAFVKPTEEIAVQIDNNATIDDIAEELYAEGVIQYPKVFSLYTRIRRDLEEVEFVAGEHMVSTSMNYDYLYKTFLPKKVRQIERITIPEGYQPIG